MAAIAADFRLVKSAIPVITELQGTPRLKAAVEEAGIGARNLIFRNYDLLVRFNPPGRAPAGTIGQPAAGASAEPSARAMIAELAPDEFLVMGFDSSVEWRPVQGSDYTAAQFLEVGEESTRTECGKPPSSAAPPRATTPAHHQASRARALMRVKLMKY